MSMRFTFTTRDWVWFCMVVAALGGWATHVRYSWWLEDNVVNHPTTVYVSDETLAGQLNDANEQLMEVKEKYAAAEYAAASIMNSDQRNEFERLKAEFLKRGR